MVEDAPETTRPRAKLKRSWLEADGRIYSSSAITLRFCLVAAAMAAMELGRREGLAFGFAVLFWTQLYQVATLQRMVAVLHGKKDRDDPRPLWLLPGWLELDGRLLGATQLGFRLLAALCAIVAVLYLDQEARVAAIMLAYLAGEGVGLFQLRVMDNLVQIEVRRRVAKARGEEFNNAWGRGDHRQDKGEGDA